jgi:hypothetical protein
MMIGPLKSKHMKIRVQVFYSGAKSMGLEPWQITYLLLRYHWQSDTVEKKNKRGKWVGEIWKDSTRSGKGYWQLKFGSWWLWK